jgi:hypothetical protein
MSDDVLITPASRKVEFFDSGGNIDGKIELSTAGDLNITSTGKITIGDITQDIHIGDGTQAVDLVFDFTSSIYSVANQDLTIGKGSLGGNDVTIDGASAVLLSLAGTEQARLTSTGLGIGTSSPDYTLDVAGNIGVDQYIYHNGDTDTYLNLQTDDARMVVGNDIAWWYDEGSASKLHLSWNGEADVEIGNAGGTPDFFFGGSQGSYNGRMGIGTATPGRPLHVVGDAYVQNGDILLSRGNFYLQDASLATYRGSFASAGVWAWENVNIGIGTTSPAATVDIKTGGSGSRTSFNAVADDLVVDSTGHTGITISSAVGSTGNLFFANPNNNARGQILYDHSGDSMRFVTGNSEKVRVNSVGDVGINQTSPAALLHIKGSENSWDKHIRLENHDTTDYGAILVDNQGMKFRTFTNGHDFHFRDNDNNTLLQIQDGAGIKFNNAYEFPTSDGSANQVLQTDGSGNLSFATVSGGGGVTLTGSTNDQLVTVTGSNAIQGESNLTLSSAGVLALTGNMTITDSHATTPTLLVEQNDTSDNALVAQFKVKDNEVLSIKNQGQLVFNLDQAGGEADEVIMLYRDTAGTERNFMSIDQGTIVIQNRGPSGDVEIRANTSTAGGSGETLMASFQTSGITFSNAYTFPTADGTVNSMLTTDGGGSLAFRNGTYLSKPAVFTDTGGHNITQTESTIPFDNEVLDPTNNASLATGLGEDGHIRLLAGGYYRISYSIPIEDDGTTAEADRTRVFCFMQTSSSSAFGSPTTVTQSRAQVYTRESSGGSGLATSFIYQHTANDYIRLRIDEQNNTNISIEDGQAQISIEYLGPA